MNIAVACLLTTIITKWVETDSFRATTSSFESSTASCYRELIIQGLPNTEYFAVQMVETGRAYTLIQGLIDCACMSKP